MPMRLFPCQCGCGGYTGRHFCPGHDQRHRGNLLRRMRYGYGTDSEEARAELIRRGWLDHNGQAPARRAPRVSRSHFVSYEPARPASRATEPSIISEAVAAAVPTLERRFGVEIEWSGGGSQQALERELRARGLRAEIQGYNHRTQPGIWKLITDASCGYELVSPPLQGEDGRRDLQRACEALVAAGCTVDRRCGLHVHHEIADLDANGMARIAKLYTDCQSLIDSVLPQSRRALGGYGNMYCQAWVDYELEALRGQSTKQSVANRQGGRYKVVNYQSYPRYGTVEFRQHSGTLEFDKMDHWVRLGQALVAAARDDVPVRADSLQSMGLDLQLGWDDVTWFERRAAQLVEQDARRAARQARQGVQGHRRPMAGAGGRSW